MTAPIPPETARRIKVVILDVDGVMTDGGVYLGATSSGEPVELKRFDITDGLGVKLLQWSGIRVAVVSGRTSPATEVRARELGIESCHQDPGARKLPFVREILAAEGASWEETAYLADDLADLPVFRRVGLPVAVPNAVDEVRRAAAWTTTREGGRGAVREFAEALLKARGEWKGLLERYLEARDDG